MGSFPGGAQEDRRSSHFMLRCVRPSHAQWMHAMRGFVTGTPGFGAIRACVAAALHTQAGQRSGFRKSLGLGVRLAVLADREPRGVLGLDRPAVPTPDLPASAAFCRFSMMTVILFAPSNRTGLRSTVKDSRSQVLPRACVRAVMAPVAGWGRLEGRGTWLATAGNNWGQDNYSCRV